MPNDENVESSHDDDPGTTQPIQDRSGPRVKRAKVVIAPEAPSVVSYSLVPPMAICSICIAISAYSAVHPLASSRNFINPLNLALLGAGLALMAIVATVGENVRLQSDYQHRKEGSVTFIIRFYKFAVALATLGFIAGLVAVYLQLE